MEMPCKDCITLAICKQRVVTIYEGSIIGINIRLLLSCSLFKEYIEHTFFTHNKKKVEEVLRYLNER